MRKISDLNSPIVVLAPRGEKCSKLHFSAATHIGVSVTNVSDRSPLHWNITITTFDETLKINEEEHLLTHYQLVKCVSQIS